MPEPDSPAPEPQAALAEALLSVLQGLARLAMAQGLPFSAVEELLKRGFVEAAREAQPDPGAARAVSRIATATGISRREVTRLVGGGPRAAGRPQSLVAEVFAHWTTASDYRDRGGPPRALPRLGPPPSFEALAQSVTRDVHPRSLLDELVRLGLARHDTDKDKVSLLRPTFVPGGDVSRMLGFVGDNVGDHLEAAVQNVASGGQSHFDQAVFAEGLSTESLHEVRSLVRAQWQHLIAALVPRLEQMLAVDEAHARPRDQRLRIGLYAFNAPLTSRRSAPAHRAPSKTGRRPRKIKPKDPAP